MKTTLSVQNSTCPQRLPSRFVTRQMKLLLLVVHQTTLLGCKAALFFSAKPSQLKI